MSQRLRHRAEGQEGFTLIELLVVILIIGILAAIAIPAFLNQRGKAYDAATKTQLRTAQTAEETYSTDNGVFTAANTGNGSTDPLVKIEPALASKPDVTATLQSGGYVLTATSTGPSGGTPVQYTDSVANGVATHTCTPASTGGCNASGAW